MHVSSLQFYIIQCILIVMKLSVIGLVQMLVVKTMSILIAMLSIFRLMSAHNSWLCCSIKFVMLCFDMLGHLGSHCLHRLHKSYMGALMQR